MTTFLLLLPISIVAKTTNSGGSNLGSTVGGTNTSSPPKHKKSKPVKKIDINPNDDDNDIWTYTLESNTYENDNFLNTTFDYSAKNGWDVQLSYYNIPVNSPSDASASWDTYLNISKTFKLNDIFTALLGTQNGTNVFSPTPQWHHFDFGLLSFQPNENIDLHAGVYWANKALSGTTDVLDFTAGFSFELIEDTLTFEGDYLHGNSGVSGATVNLFYRFLPKIQVYMGVGIPETDSGNEFFGTLGFSVASKIIHQ